MPTARLLTVHLPDPGLDRPTADLVDWDAARELVAAHQQAGEMTSKLELLHAALADPDRAPLKRLLVSGYQVLHFWDEDGGDREPAELYRAASPLAALGVFGEGARVRDAPISA